MEGKKSMIEARRADQGTTTAPAGAASEHAIEQVRDTLRGLKYGVVTIIVQDGVVVQIERTERRRLK